MGIGVLDAGKEIMKNKTFVYIAGPYAGPTHDSGSYLIIDANIGRARYAASRLANAGVPYFCPHLNSAHFEVITPDVEPSFWYDLDMRILKFSSALLLLDGWEGSKGTNMERDEALALGLPCFEITDFDELVAWWKAGKK